MSQGIKTARGRGAGFSWTQDGKCRGVLVETSSGKCRVSSYWSADTGGKSAGVAEALSTGRRALGLGDTDYCVAGPAGGGWGMADIQMPALKPDALQSALAFELRKLTPVPVERLTWGYRSLGVAEDGRLRLRVFYARTDFWRKWIETANGLGHLDMLAPAPVLLDPLFDGMKVVLASEGPFSYIPNANGREVMPGGDAATLESMLPSDGLDIGKLSELDEAARREYAEAICMALYAMGRELSKDGGTMPQMPSHLKPSRFFAVKMLSACLFVVVLFFLGAGLVKGLQQRAARLRLIKKDISAVEAQIKSISNGIVANGDQAAKNLEAEIAKYSFDTPELPDVLMEITDMVKPPAWLAGSFEWNRDNASNVVSVSFTIREPAGDDSNIDLISQLNRSPIMGDVSAPKATDRPGFKERRVTLKARYDTQEEKEFLEKEREEAQRKAAEAPETPPAEGNEPPPAEGDVPQAEDGGDLEVEIERED